MSKQKNVSFGRAAATPPAASSSELAPSGSSQPAWLRRHRQVAEMLEKNPAPELETIFAGDRVWIFELTEEERKDPEMRRIANQMASTNVRFMIAKANAHFRERALRLAEQKAEEARKAGQIKALEFCVEEAKLFPEVVEMFRRAFAALEEARAQTT